jgi:uncharacterized protein (TIGR02453 family)
MSDFPLMRVAMNNLASVLDFLAELEKNNARSWFEEHRSQYQKAKDTFEALVNQVIDEYRPVEDLGGITAKDCVMRIFRDMRFSKDKLPYRTSLAASIAAGGRKSGRMAYYLHLEPHNRSMIAGGLYMPEPEQITRFRETIARRPAPFKSIIGDPVFKQYFGSLQGEKLKTAPKGFAPDHPEIELLRLKDVVAVHTVSDAAVLADDFTGHIVKVFAALKPFLDYLNENEF